VNHFTGDFGTRIAYWFGRDVGSFVLQDGVTCATQSSMEKWPRSPLATCSAPDPAMS
jgi:hypothetical protein